MEEIQNIKSIALVDGETLTNVQSAELSDSGLLKVYLRGSTVSQVPIKGVSYFPAHAWNRINIDLHTLQIHGPDGKTETFAGVDRGTVEEKVFSRLIEDGSPEEASREYAQKVARGDNNLRPAGPSMYVFQLF